MYSHSVEVSAAAARSVSVHLPKVVISTQFLCVSSEIPTTDGTNLLGLGQQCGGYIDSTTLLERGYMRDDGQTDNTPKGFICPIGQICMVSTPLMYAMLVLTNSFRFRSRNPTRMRM